MSISGTFFPTHYLKEEPVEIRKRFLSSAYVNPIFLIILVLRSHSMPQGGLMPSRQHILYEILRIVIIIFIIMLSRCLEKI